MLARLARRLLGTGPERWTRLATFAVVAASTIFVIAQLHPARLFWNTEDVGGDTAAHITAPYYMIHYLLPHGEISGWDSWWFDGFPLYVFYFPFPALVVAFLNLFSPYAVAFKLVTVLGVVTLPTCCYAFGRLAALRRPIPALLAAGAVSYIFNNSYTIDGGNLFSSMAGEFSFSLSLGFAILFLGTVAYALRTGKLRWLAAVLFLLTVLSHVIPALFAAGAALLLAVFHTGSKPLRRVLVPVGVAGGLLCAFWLLPFGVYVSHYSSSMNYGPVSGVGANFFPTGELPVIILGLIGFLLAVWRAERMMATLGVAGLCMIALFEKGPSGLVYNARWLPFWFLAMTFLAAYAVGELGRMAFASWRLVSLNELVTPVAAGAITVGVITSWLAVWPTPFKTFNFTSRQNSADGWTAFNFAGYQKMQGWPELQRVIEMLDAVGHRYGCGRLDYEYTGNDTGYFGSTLVEMSFPMWTGGCIDSTEGVYFESATTTHFHFLDQAELSLVASNPVAGLPYENTSVVDGIKHLQLQGVQYFLANSPQIEAQAAADPSLVLLAKTPADPADIDLPYASPGPGLAPPPAKAWWMVYKIKDSPLVRPLQYDPAVEAGLNVVAISTNYNVVSGSSIPVVWYQQKQYWSVPLASTGPSSWPRFKLGTLVSPQRSRRVVPAVVSDVRHDLTYSSISFDVSRTGSPVEVDVPYFPNWQATGAAGPYLVTPNLMVVVPTSHHVVLRYGTTSVDWIGTGGTVAGIALTAALVRPGALPPRRGGADPARPAVPDPAEGPGTFEPAAERDGPDDEEDDATDDTSGTDPGMPRNGEPDGTGGRYSRTAGSDTPDDIDGARRAGGRPPGPPSIPW
ncbi:MAG TPA: hypothetical protein VMD59_18045, partial [Acidimicrobiales bacterium]|nr:hypothetical protein [Acidimicrobiales bacterium]